MRRLKSKGFTLIEVIVDLLVISMISLAVVGAYSAAFKSIEYARTKISAVALANEKMEVLHNMPYNSLATVNGLIYPPGQILDSEDINRNGFNFQLRTTISCVDDPYDGNAEGTIAGKPKDLNICDYKKAKVEVSKEGRPPTLAKIVTDIAANAAETAGDTGIIKLCVFDSGLNPVNEATVELTNDEFPDLHMSGVTDETGCLFFPNLPPNTHNYYHVVATKPGYSTDQTYDRTSQNKNEDQRDLDVLAQQVTPQSLYIDQVGQLQVSVKDTAGNPNPDIDIRVYSEKLKWTNPITPKYDQVLKTDGDGLITLANMEYDNYIFEAASTGYYVKTVTPYQPVYLPGGGNISANIVLTSSASDIRIYNSLPLQGEVGDNSLAIKISGENLSGIEVAKLIKGSLEIVGNISYTTNNEAEVVFDLTGAETGFYDLFLSKGGLSVHQINSLEIVLP